MEKQVMKLPVRPSLQRLTNVAAYIQTQGYIVKRKEPMVKRKKAPAFDHWPHFYCKMLFST